MSRAIARAAHQHADDDAERGRQREADQDAPDADQMWM